MKKALLVLVLIVLLVVALVGLKFNGYRSATKGTSGGAPVSFTVSPGASLSGLGPSLASSGVISSTLDFKIYLRLSGTSASLQQGSYTLRRGMPYGDIVATLAKGPALQFEKVTIPEGLTVTETASKVGGASHITAAAFLAAATPATVQPTILPATGTSLEGFLYPQTYFVDPKKDDAASLVTQMVDQFVTETATVNWAAAPAGISPYQALVVASLIQNEAKVPTDGPLIASVIYNRLHLGMPLGVDAAIYYGLGRPLGPPLTQSQLATKSPYNTRINVGLPPTPISSPQLSSIQSALAPAQTQDLYYILSSDCVHNSFFTNKADFDRAAAHQPSC